MVDVVLVFPSTIHSHSIPLGIAYIGAILENAGYSVSVIDLAAENLSVGELIQKVKRLKPKVLGFSVPSIQYRKSISIIQSIRRVLPETYLTMGGPHPSACGSDILTEIPELDGIIIGEGEITTLQLVECVLNGKGSLHKVDGLVFRDKNKIIEKKPRRLIKDLNSLPFPGRHLFRGKYITHTILTSRGCPYGCIFCDKSIFGRSWRARSAKNVVDEIEFLQTKYPMNKNPISIVDDVFNLDIDRAKDICDEILARKLKASFACQNGIRADFIDEELLRKMKQAGWVYIQFGIETGDEEVFQSIGKRETIEQIKNAVRMTKKVGIEVGGSFIVDLPGMTLERIKNTEKLVQELQLNNATFNFATPIPNTKLWDHVLNNNEAHLLVDPLESKWGKPVFETPEFSANEKMQAFRLCCEARNRIVLKHLFFKAMNPSYIFRAKTLGNIPIYIRTLYRLLTGRGWQRKV